MATTIAKRRKTRKKKIITRLDVAQQLARRRWMTHRLTVMFNRCEATGMDEESFAGIKKAGLELSRGFTTRIGLRGTLVSFPRYRTDRDFIEDLVAAQELLALRINKLDRNIELWTVQRARAREVYFHSTDAAVRFQAWATWKDCSLALEIAEVARDRFWLALCWLNSVHDDLEETYQVVYELVRAGRVLPYNGRWISGEADSGPLHRTAHTYYRNWTVHRAYKQVREQKR